MHQPPSPPPQQQQENTSGGGYYHLNIMEVVPLDSESMERRSAEVVLSLTKPDKQQQQQQQQLQQQLTPLQRRNVVFLILGFSCVVAVLALIVGNGALVIQSIGGSSAIAPLFLACFFLGMSMVNLTVTHLIFDRFGRTIGFWFGCFLTVLGSIVGTIGVWISSSTIVLLANFIFGAGTGTGMYLRFASVEVVPPAFASKAVTWTLCGGCLAAFVGPEVAAAVTGVFGTGNMTYLGIFIITFWFAVVQAVLVGLVQFDQPNNRIQEKDLEAIPEKVEADKSHDDTTLVSLLVKSDFLFPVLISVFSWSIMAQSKSIVRVTMREFGFTDRQSLSVIEFHFLSMFGPGFVSGSFIQTYGTLPSCHLAVVCFLIGTAINLSIQANNNTTAPWFLGLMFLGIGWNFGFSAATVWVTKVYASLPQFKSQVQAANEAGTFLLSGMLISSTGFLYDAGSGGQEGWRALNYFMLALIALLVVVVAWAMKLSYNESGSVNQRSLDDIVDAIETADKKSEEMDA